MLLHSLAHPAALRALSDALDAVPAPLAHRRLLAAYTALTGLTAALASAMGV